MKFKKSLQIVYVNFEYLKYLHEIDSEVHFEDTEEYRNKPHVGILINENDFEYVIPLTSAKKKHELWDDVTASYYRIYDIIDIRDHVPRKNDIIVPIKNHKILASIPDEEKNIACNRFILC